MKRRGDELARPPPKRRLVSFRCFDIYANRHARNVVTMVGSGKTFDIEVDVPRWQAVAEGGVEKHVFDWSGDTVVMVEPRVSGSPNKPTYNSNIGSVQHFCATERVCFGDTVSLQEIGDRYTFVRAVRCTGPVRLSLTRKYGPETRKAYLEWLPATNTIRRLSNVNAVDVAYSFPSNGLGLVHDLLRGAGQPLADISVASTRADKSYVYVYPPRAACLQSDTVNASFSETVRLFCRSFEMAVHLQELTGCPIYVQSRISMTRIGQYLELSHCTGVLLPDELPGREEEATKVDRMTIRPKKGPVTCEGDSESLVSVDFDSMYTCAFLALYDEAPPTTAHRIHCIVLKELLNAKRRHAGGPYRAAVKLLLNAYGYGSVGQRYTRLFPCSLPVMRAVASTANDKMLLTKRNFETAPGPGLTILHSCSDSFILRGDVAHIQTLVTRHNEANVYHRLRVEGIWSCGFFRHTNCYVLQKAPKTFNPATDVRKGDWFASCNVPYVARQWAHEAVCRIIQFPDTGPEAALMQTFDDVVTHTALTYSDVRCSLLYPTDFFFGAPKVWRCTTKGEFEVYVQGRWATLNRGQTVSVREMLRKVYFDEFCRGLHWKNA